MIVASVTESSHAFSEDSSEDKKAAKDTSPGIRSSKQGSRKKKKQDTGGKSRKRRKGKKRGSSSDDSDSSSEEEPFSASELSSIRRGRSAGSGGSPNLKKDKAAKLDEMLASNQVLATTMTT